MFTGIVQDLGRVLRREPRGGDLRLTIGCGRLDLSATRVGDSLCVQGCCLTVVELDGNSFAADLSRETLALTTLGELEPGAKVNLEPALRAGDPLGGHLVSGHIDGVARITGLQEDARSRRLTIETSALLARYLAPKGSVALDGVSLTINAVQGPSFGVNIIPHTRDQTTLGELGVGGRVNLEVDQVARYVHRLMLPYADAGPGS
ncbi:MAG: riboflavin synthase [Gammaproteobacteria bacterium]|nr:riboflavin synthase [Gammaproteobacteria bacterium]MBV8403166.1 riboflavin synthase [Gammaproteobacteria bacterium]